MGSIRYHQQLSRHLHIDRSNFCGIRSTDGPIEEDKSCTRIRVTSSVRLYTPFSINYGKSELIS
jgi:hypothetical protein